MASFAGMYFTTKSPAAQRQFFPGLHGVIVELRSLSWRADRHHPAVSELQEDPAGGVWPGSVTVPGGADLVGQCVEQKISERVELCSLNGRHTSPKLLNENFCTFSGTL